MRIDGKIKTNSGTVKAKGLDKRGGAQKGRVKAGIKEGSIDKSEFKQLGKAKNHVAGKLNEFKANDGRVDRGERLSLHGDLNRISGKIHEFRNDGDAASTSSSSGAGRKGQLGEKESFEASIIGDPHFTIDGSVNGENVSAAFDNHDIGTRTQYRGKGFGLQTDTVAWGSENGAAVVDSATVTTGFGRGQKEVTVGSDGSVQVGGRDVSLEVGESKQLNRTSTLSHNEDGSYTVSSRNGKVTNNIKAHEHENGNFLNIYSSVDDVQTVGWLQNQA